MNEGEFLVGDCPHTSDAYYSHVVVGRSSLVVPYINYGILNHQLNAGRSARYIDFCYLVCRDVVYLGIDGLTVIGSKSPDNELLYFGGLSLDENSDFGDFEVDCKVASIQLLSESRISSEMWIAVDSPLRNLSTEAVAAFFRGDNMPDSIRHLINSNVRG